MSLLRRTLASIILPRTITEFEASYLARMNRIGFGFLAMHVPALALIAAFNDTGPGLAALLATALLVGPALAYRAFANPRVISLVYGFTTMSMGGLLVHFGQGPMQIEMHFYFFALLAMLVIFGNPMVILVATATVVVHHLILWLVLPSSVFNYDARVWVVAVHASFVALESIAACFIARSFFDNVIGLERIGQRRALELAARNKEMRRVLDNVQQGLLTLDRAGVIADERSAVLEQWLGPIPPGARFADTLRRFDREIGEWFDVGWPEVVDAVMPLELTLAQLPAKLSIGARHLELVYLPIDPVDGVFDRLLVMISDATPAVERARLEADQRELTQLFERHAIDRRGVIEFIEEGSDLVATATSRSSGAAVVLRALHTLKGNAGVLGMSSLVSTCHALEGELAERGVLSETALHGLVERWRVVHSVMQPLLGERGVRAIEVDVSAHSGVVEALHQLRPHVEIAREVESWALEPMTHRLERMAEHTRRIARRAGKGEVDVAILDHGVRLRADDYAPFWSAFVHVVRNAIDHGLEPAALRVELGKPARGRIELSTRFDGDELVVAIEDDGRGIDLEAVKAAALRRGVAIDGADDAVAAIFHDGVSTAGATQELSGRGVGMGAVQAACAALGGHVVTRSQPGRFTRFEFRFPAAVRSRSLAA